MSAQAGLVAPAPQRRARSRVFVGFALLVLASALVGFFTTYLRPVWRAEFHGPWRAHVHGALLATWLLVFLAQTLLVRARKVTTHRTLGWAGVARYPDSGKFGILAEFPPGPDGAPQVFRYIGKPGVATGYWEGEGE